MWHFSPLSAGVGIAPAPLASIAFAMNAGPIQRRFGRTAPAVAGTLAMALAVVYWLAAVHTTPDYWGGMFPCLILVGLAGGLAQAPLFAAAGSLAPKRATTGSAVLNMSRQIGSAVGVAVLVALTPHATIEGFDHAWWVQAVAGLAAGTAMLAFGPATRPDQSAPPHDLTNRACSRSERSRNRYGPSRTFPAHNRASFDIPTP